MSESTRVRNGLFLAEEGNTLTIEGGVDLANAPVLRHRLHRLRQRHQTVIIDIAGVTYMDSSGFGALFRFCRELRHQGGQLVLRRPTAHIRRMLEITDMLRFFTVDEAGDGRYAPG